MEEAGGGNEYKIGKLYTEQDLERFSNEELQGIIDKVMGLSQKYANGTGFDLREDFKNMRIAARILTERVDGLKATREDNN